MIFMARNNTTSHTSQQSKGKVKGITLK